MYPNYPRSHQKFAKSCTWDIFSLLGLGKQFFFTVPFPSKIITKQGQYHRNRSFAWCWCLVYMLFRNRGLPVVVFAFLASKGFLTCDIPVRLTACLFLDIISFDAWIVALVTTETPFPWMCWRVLFWSDPSVCGVCEGRGENVPFGKMWRNICTVCNHKAFLQSGFACGF